MADDHMTRAQDPLEIRARALAQEAGLDPDARAPHPTKPGRTMPAWCTFRDAARAERTAQAQAALAEDLAAQPDSVAYQQGRLRILGSHEPGTVSQMHNCLRVGPAVAGVLCADGHLGYAQPVGGVIAYENAISISGVGFDIGCGNLAVRTDLQAANIKVPELVEQIRQTISFGVGRKNQQRVDHPVFDAREMWLQADATDLLDKARAQLGTVGSGNHYVDLFADEEDRLWVGVHFGSRGLGHTLATRYLKAAGGRDGINVPPTIVGLDTDLGQRYRAAMELAGLYAYAGREWVVDQVLRLAGARAVDAVHNHHNFAWLEEHDGRPAWVVRKGATPAFPGQRGFVGGSMGDDAVILEGVDTPEARANLYSTVHGAGRVMGRFAAKKSLDRGEMERWLRRRGIFLVGGGLDESPMAYRRLDDVLVHHADSVRVLHRLRPLAVLMAGADERDPYGD
jgi:tRNA-splicing ligase RtcB (3'-phosphate/5'-hydroxy nucleic acid ligase)